MRFLSVILLLGVLPAAGQGQRPQGLRDPDQGVAPYVASPPTIVDRMLDMAAVKPGEVVYDLGCGDGRILITAAQKYRARAVGVELSSRLYQLTLDLVRRLNLSDQITVLHGNLMDVNFSDADVVTLYLETGSNNTLRPKLEKFLRSGARVVSHDFEVRGWKPVQVDKVQAFNRNHLIYLYQIPASLKSQSRPRVDSLR